MVSTCILLRKGFSLTQGVVFLPHSRQGETIKLTLGGGGDVGLSMAAGWRGVAVHPLPVGEFKGVALHLPGRGRGSL